MRNIRVRGGSGALVAGIASAALAVSMSSAGFAATAEDRNDLNQVTNQVADAHDDLAEANSKVAAAMDKLNAARAQLPAAQSTLAQAQAEQAAADEADRLAQAELEQATAAALRAEQERQQIEQEIAALREEVGGFARTLYQQGAFADLDVLLEASNPGEFAARAASLDAVSRANNSALDRMAEKRADLVIKEIKLKALREQVEQKKQAAEAALARANAASAAAAAAKAKVDALVSSRSAALQVTAAEQSKVLGQYNALKREQARIAEVLRKAAAAAAARAAAAAAAAAAQAARGGTGGTGSIDPGSVVVPDSGDGFTWPVPGHGVTSNAGPRIHPVYGYASCHTGTDVGAPTGTPILSAKSGVVIGVYNGGPYGMHTLVLHSNGYSTMYAHQSGFAVKVGQKVKAGEVIGYVGSTGWSTGPHLHFQIMIGEVPWNPMGWFGGTKAPVPCSGKTPIR